MEHFLQLVGQYWTLAIFICIAVAILLLVMKLVRILVIFAIVATLIVFISHGYTPKEMVDKVAETGKKTVQMASNALKESIQSSLEKELKNATYKTNPDGTYDIKTASVELKGKVGDEKGQIIYKGQTYELNIGDLGDKVQKQVQTLQAQK